MTVISSSEQYQDCGGEHGLPSCQKAVDQAPHHLQHEATGWDWHRRVANHGAACLPDWHKHLQCPLGLKKVATRST